MRQYVPIIFYLVLFCLFARSLAHSFTFSPPFPLLFDCGATLSSADYSRLLSVSASMLSTSLLTHSSLHTFIPHGVHVIRFFLYFSRLIVYRLMFTFFPSALSRILFGLSLLARLILFSPSISFSVIICLRFGCFLLSFFFSLPTILRYSFLHFIPRGAACTRKYEQLSAWCNDDLVCTIVDTSTGAITPAGHFISERCLGHDSKVFIGRFRAAFSSVFQKSIPIYSPSV